MNKFVILFGLFHFFLAFNSLVRSNSDSEIPEYEVLQESIDIKEPSPAEESIPEIPVIDSDITPVVEEAETFIPFEESERQFEPEPELQVFDEIVTPEPDIPVSTEAPNDSSNINTFEPTVAESTDGNEKTCSHSKGIITNVKSVVTKTKSFVGDYLKAFFTFWRSIIGNFIQKKR